MPSFDIESTFDRHEMTNAVDQANKELERRFDFKGIDATFELTENSVDLTAEESFHVDQMFSILVTALTKRKLDVRSLGESTTNRTGRKMTRSYPLKQGIDQPTAKKIIKVIKDAKLKVQASIQGEQVRVTGKKRDDLQETMGLLRGNDEIPVPLTFTNFRD
ncbi:MAG: YajQ family cyclic di-GMP-binding protein [unclassified Hahellaceae]|nr:YajQ family cyclic di-GMP-binding protein [Hahellaceae bacterium]